MKTQKDDRIRQAFSRMGPFLKTHCPEDARFFKLNPVDITRLPPELLEWLYDNMTPDEKSQVARLVVH